MTRMIVQKYGGSSVADTDKIQRVARRIGKTQDEGNQVLVVVSAMGETTDELIEKAYQISQKPEEREMDALLSTGELISSTLLTMALHSLGYKAISLSGSQAGIQTDSVYSRARIVNIGPKRIHNELQKGNVVIVAGFQGINPEEDTTTLGRGGSDTTAVALAISMKADECQIYTDVAGIHAADPRLVPEAVKLNEIGYDEMLEMASSGAKVMHSRAVELAELYNMPILVASSFGDQAGTIICKETAMEQKNRIRGIAHDTNVASITVQRIPDIPGIAAKILGPLAKAGISIDTIIKNTSFEGITDFTFTVGRNDLARTKDIIDELIKNIGAKTYITDSSQAKVSIIGTGMQNAPGYAALMFQTLYENDINIQLISTSEIKITCIISEEDVKKAVQALYASFEQEMVKSTGI